MTRSFRSGLVKVLNRLMSLVGDVCVNELRDAIAGAPRGVQTCVIHVGSMIHSPLPLTAMAYERPGVEDVSLHHLWVMWVWCRMWK